MQGLNPFPNKDGGQHRLNSHGTGVSWECAMFLIGNLLCDEIESGIHFAFVIWILSTTIPSHKRNIFRQYIGIVSQNYVKERCVGVCVCVYVFMYACVHIYELGMIFLKYLTSLTLYLTLQNVQTPSVLFNNIYRWIYRAL